MPKHHTLSEELQMKMALDDPANLLDSWEEAEMIEEKGEGRLRPNFPPPETHIKKRPLAHIETR